MSGLSAFQVEVAKLFFGLPAARGFVLAGGGGLLAAGLTDRPTHDLDFFGAPGDADVGLARDEFEAAAGRRDWRIVRLHDRLMFVRLLVLGPDGELVVEFAIDAAPSRPTVTTFVGPTFDFEELAGRKLAALFGRAEARDFADVYLLAARFDRTLLVQRAKDVDLGVDERLLAEMMGTLDRFVDDELPIEQSRVQDLRAFFRNWSDELRSIR